MPMLEETPEYMLGRWGELIALALLRQWSWSVIATCDYCGRSGGSSPRWYSPNDDIVPDMYLCKDGFSAWLDAKVKTRIHIQHNTGDTPEHGINDDHRIAYGNTERTTGHPVAIAIVEVCSGMFRCNTLAGLGMPRIYDGPNYTPMSSWNREMFPVIATLNRDKLKRLIFADESEYKIRSPEKYTGDRKQLEKLARWVFPCQGRGFEASTVFEKIIKGPVASQYGGAGARAYAAGMKPR